MFDALTARVAESNNKRMDAVNHISFSTSNIVTNAGRELFDKQPTLHELLHVHWGFIPD